MRPTRSDDDSLVEYLAHQFLKSEETDSETAFVSWCFLAVAEGEVEAAYPDVKVRASRTCLLQEKKLYSEAGQFPSLLVKCGKWCYVSMAAVLEAPHP